MELRSVLANSKIAACAGVAVLFFALPVAALAPVKFSQTLTQSFTFTTCSYGDVNATATLNVQGIAFRDASLSTTRVELQLFATTTITNPLNNKSATGMQTSNETFYVADNSFVLRGLDQSIRVPGGGVVLQIAGRIAVDGNGNVVFATPLFQNVDLGPLCAALQ